MTKALSYCDDILTLIKLHNLVRTSELSPEEIQALRENVNIDSILSAIGENTGEAFGSYIPQILAPIFNDLLSSVPDLYNPLLSVNSSLINALKKLMKITTGTSALVLTSCSYFGLANIRRTLMQSSMISGGLSVGLFYQDHLQIEQVEEIAEEITQTLLEIICSYTGMRLFGTDESFSGYFHKIVPAILSSKSVENLDFSESHAIIPFILSLFVSSIVYNQADIRVFIQEHNRSLQRFLQNISSGKAVRQTLQPISALIISYVNDIASNMLSQQVLKNKAISIDSFLKGSSDETSLISNPLTINPFPGIAELNPAVLKLAFSVSEVALNDFFCFFINQSFAPALEEIALESLEHLLSQYLAILQQEELQNILEELKPHLLDTRGEELKNQFFKKVFLKITGKELTLNNSSLSLFRRKYEISCSVFENFKFTPTLIRMLWNSCTYDKKIELALLIEVLLQGFAISGLALIHVKLDILNSSLPEIPAISYIKVANLGKKLIS